MRGGSEEKKKKKRKDEAVSGGCLIPHPQPHGKAPIRQEEERKKAGRNSRGGTWLCPGTAKVQQELKDGDPVGDLTPFRTRMTLWYKST